MTGPDRLDRLAQLAAMIREAELARLAEASRRRDAARAALARFDAAAPGDAPGAMDDARAALIAARHQEWRAAKRAQLNIALARETAAWSCVQDRAARAFGRSDVLARLARERRDKR